MSSLFQVFNFKINEKRQGRSNSGRNTCYLLQPSNSTTKKKDYKPKKKCIEVYQQEHHPWHVAITFIWHPHLTIINTITTRNTAQPINPPITAAPVFTDSLFLPSHRRDSFSFLGQAFPLHDAGVSTDLDRDSDSCSSLLEERHELQVDQALTSQSSG